MLITLIATLSVSLILLERYWKPKKQNPITDQRRTRQQLQNELIDTAQCLSSSAPVTKITDPTDAKVFTIEVTVSGQVSVKVEQAIPSTPHLIKDRNTILSYLQLVKTFLDNQEDQEDDGTMPWSI